MVEKLGWEKFFDKIQGRGYLMELEKVDDWSRCLL